MREASRSSEWDRGLPSGFAVTSIRLVMFINPGDHNEGETPVPIPNTEAKPLGADGTARGAWWESRTLPGLFYR